MKNTESLNPKGKEQERGEKKKKKQVVQKRQQLAKGQF